MRRQLRRLRYWIAARPLRQALAALVALAVAAAISFGGFLLANPSHSCGSPGVNHPDGRSAECVGVTDGSFDFAPDLHTVDQAIRAENEKVGYGSGVVTVAVIADMTPSEASVNTGIEQMVAGAYLAQYRADETSSSTYPRIRLVLANAGAGNAQWAAVAAQLKQLTAAPDNLRAVTGIDISTTATKQEVSWLTGQGIPVVGGTITADDIANATTGNGTSNGAFPGLARVSPTDSDEATALTSLGTVNPAQTQLVEDLRPGDNYISTLAKAFTASVAGAPYQPLTFTSPDDVNSDGATENTFNLETITVCQRAPRFIYFAGRHVQLRQFLNDLGHNCPQHPFTVLAGDDANHLITDKQLDTRIFGPRLITLEYAALATSDAWSGPSSLANTPYAQGYRDFLTANQSQRAFPPLTNEQLADGEAMIAHDTIWTAFQAMSYLVSNPIQVPSLSRVAQEWHLLNGQFKVAGASGWICLDNAGNPYDKLVPIVEFTAKGPLFVQPGWPKAKPPTDTCSA